MFGAGSENRSCRTAPVARGPGVPRCHGPSAIAGGVLGDLATRVAVGYLLVAMLRGIFDPSPDGLAVPSIFVSALNASVTPIGILVCFVVGRLAARASPSQRCDR
jgi:hypothetical protein